MKSCIYKIMSMINPGRIYIGSTKNFIERKKLHLKHIRSGKHHSILLQRHVNKYGLDDLIFETIEEVTDNAKLLIREQYYLDSMNPYFNICKVAGSSLGSRMSQNTKRKMSMSRIGHTVTAETRLKISKSHLGKKKRPEHVEASKKANTGRKLTDQHKLNISKGSQNRSPISEETRQKIRAATTGRKHSKQARLNMSIAAKNRKRTKRGSYKKKLMSEGRFKKVDLMKIIKIDSLNKTGVSTEKIGAMFDLDGSTIRKYLRALRSGEFDQELKLIV